MPRILLLLPAAGERYEDFVTAALDMNVEVVTAADGTRQPERLTGMSSILALPFDQPELAVEQALVALGPQLDAVLAIDDHGLELAALLIQRLGLPGNSVAALRTTRDRLAFRQLQKSYAFNCPHFRTPASEAEAIALAPSLQYPVVVNARRLSSSWGVIRADDATSYVRAVARIHRIQSSADRDAAESGCIVESFIPGREYALEGFLQNGALRVMALFDKPASLDAPYFEETIYVTPSRLPPNTQATIAADVQRACALAGLITGPVHAAMRVNDQGVWLLEVATRCISGLCARVLRHHLSMTLEELLLRSALRLPLPIAADADATGVMTIPIPEHGIFRGVTGLAAARTVAGLQDIQITAQPGQTVTPPPEGSGSLGFIFSRAATPEAAEATLRAVHGELGFDIQAELAVIGA